jgi:hypothetical protein
VGFVRRAHPEASSFKASGLIRPSFGDERIASLGLLWVKISRSRAGNQRPFFGPHRPSAPMRLTCHS